MKRTIFGIAFIVSMQSVYGMEDKKGQIFMCSTFPKIFIVQDDIYNRCTKNTDITVVGEREQIKLKHPSLTNSPLVGCMSFLYSDTRIMRRNKVFAQCFDPTYGFDDESAAIIVNGQRFIIKNPRDFIEYKKIDSKLAFIREPQLLCKKSDNSTPIIDLYIYRKTKDKVSKNSSELETVEYTGKEALEEAFKDLGRCYKKTLIYAHQIFSENGEVRSIAFPQLSISFGFPLYNVAYEVLQSIIQFTKDDNHKDKYDAIQLVVQKEYDFDVYQQILITLAADTMEKNKEREVCDEKL